MQSFIEILGKGEKAINIFSFYHNVFYPKTGKLGRYAHLHAVVSYYYQTLN